MMAEEHPYDPQQEKTDPPTHTSGNSAEASALESMFGEEPARPGPAPGSPCQSNGTSEHLRGVKEALAQLRDQLTEIGAEVKQVKTERHVLTEMHNRCRELAEQHYHREVLGPFFQGMIGIADRCRQQSTTLNCILQKHASSGNKAAVEAIRYLLDARKADRIEVESLLANYGVESFESSEERFDPTTQKCISKTDTHNAGLAGNIAQRLLPGYRREDRLIRQEYVNVYALKARANHLSTGEES